ncbi:MAG: sulfatase-like hydrolase/transferase [Polyangiaceae bacterium]|nr:sulfatase-like hydrolase/transferase [Polyangiaceae bacterium]
MAQSSNESTPAEQPSRLARLGEACVFGVCVAALAAVPTALRTSAQGGHFFDGLIVGDAALLPIVTLSIVMLRAAGRGVRGLIGQAPTRVDVLRIALWIGLALPALAVLATLLKAVTHHRGLGGATFGVFGLAAVAASALLAYRLVDIGEKLVAKGFKSWVLAAIGAAIGVAPVLVVAAPLASSEAGAVGAAIVDGLIAAIAMALIVTVDLGPRWRKIAGVWGIPFAALVLITATARLEATPSVGKAVQAGGGLAATLLHGLEGWTDRDGDGEGAHFGGADCDEGNSARNTRTPEIPGDGIDQNCDGTDPSASPVVSAPSASAQGSVAVANTAASAAPNSAKKPDILLITLDSFRSDRMSAYGYEKPTTPRLAELAKRGALFSRVYAAASDTQRAYVPIVTGRRYANAARDKREWPTLLGDNDTLAERLHRSGYVTAAVTSFTWLSDERGFDQGFDRFETVYKEAHPERGVTGPFAIRAARKILSDLSDRAQPIFIWVHLFDAHEKYQEHRGIDFGKGRGADYDGEVAFVDQQIGTLLDDVAKSPRASNMAIFVHGTNGEGLDEHEITGHSGELFEEFLRVPLIAVVPGAAPTKVEPAVSMVDLVPTLLDLAGAPKEGTDGASLLPAIRGLGAVNAGPVFVRSKKGAALIMGDQKLMVMERKKGKLSLLFDLAKDPGEKKDLAPEKPEDIEKLLKVLSDVEGETVKN